MRRRGCGFGLWLFAAGCTFDLAPPQHLDAGSGVVPDGIVCLLGVGDVEAQHLGGLSVSPSSAMFITGDFTGTMDFGKDVLTNAGPARAGFVAKIDPACGPEWARVLLSSSDITVPAVVVDGERAVIAGWFAGDLDIDGAVFSAATGDGKDAFVAAFDAKGQRETVLHLGGVGQQTAAALAVGGGATIVGGAFASELRVGASAADAGAPLITSNGGTSGFVIKLASSGTELLPVWAQALEMTGAGPGQGVSAVALDRSGNVFAAGTFSGTLSFSEGNCSPIPSPGAVGIFVSKLDPKGACLWVRGYGADLATGIAVDSKGDAVVVGSFKGSVDFGDRTWTAAANNHNAFLAKLSGDDGSTRWSLGFGDAEEQHGAGIALGSDDSIFVTVDLSAGADFDPSHEGGDIESVGGPDVVVAKYDAAGAFQWVRQYGDAGEQRSARVGLDSAGGVVLAGELGGGKLGLGPNAISGDTRRNVFVMRIPP